MKTILMLSLFLMAACSNPFDGRGKLVFRDMKQEEIDAIKAKEDARKHFLIEKKLVMETIVKDANDSFEDIKPIITRKCFDCHDSNTKLRFYARILPGINPLFKHQENGLKALDFSGNYPLQAQGNPPQLSLLKSFRNAVIDRTMPLKSYRFVYRSKAITDEDQERILAWIDPLITRLEDYEAKYESTSNDVALEAHKIFEQKCFRCHANGNKKGGFGGMENTEKLVTSKYVNSENPDQSELNTITLNGKMPPNKRDALTDQESLILQDWLIQVTRKSSKN
jgi:mono/diheme cytochrome c family protein